MKIRATKLILYHEFQTLRLKTLGDIPFQITNVKGETFTLNYAKIENIRIDENAYVDYMVTEKNGELVETLFVAGTSGDMRKKNGITMEAKTTITTEQSKIFFREMMDCYMIMKIGKWDIPNLTMQEVVRMINKSEELVFEKDGFIFQKNTEDFVMYTMDVEQNYQFSHIHMLEVPILNEEIQEQIQRKALLDREKRMKIIHKAETIINKNRTRLLFKG